MIIITIGDIISISFGIIFLLFLILFFIFSFSINLYKQKSKKWLNCFECKNYYCSGVSSVGGYSYDKCKITGNEDTHKFNEDVEYRKCKNFIAKK